MVKVDEFLNRLSLYFEVMDNYWYYQYLCSCQYWTGAKCLYAAIAIMIIIVNHVLICCRKLMTIALLIVPVVLFSSCNITWGRCWGW